jgi:hypothetical protein
MGFEGSSRSVRIFVGVNARSFVLVMARGKATKFGVEKKRRMSKIADSWWAGLPWCGG